MSRRPRSTESPVSLFTFLDVLMCTMGALILLLIVLSTKMRPEANLEDLFAPHRATEQPESKAAVEEVPSVPAVPRYTAADRERDLAERAANREKRRADLASTVAAVLADRDREQKQLHDRQRLIDKAGRKLREAQDRAARAGSQSDAAQQAQAAAVAAEQKLKGLEEQVVEQI